ncbi:unnamed protein product [Pedinophyceae sp. YPF-701]|nr:unnamed protein product [Pedinophyceae sp. YPF-701]
MRDMAIYQVDAFTRNPFKGNPAAVALLPEELLPMSDALRQDIAAEMNLAETAFLECDGPGDFQNSPRFKLRWFTPTMEVPLCGHATLASAAALITACNNSAPELTFSTLSGDLVIRRGGAERDGNAVALRMDLPHIPPSDAVPEAAAALARAAAGGLPVAEVVFAKPLRYLIVALEAGSVTPEELAGAQVDVGAMKAAYSGADGAIGAVVLACCDPRAAGTVASPHVFSRFFAPWMGVEEDPVTGSAHSVLAAYYAEKLGRTTLACRQCSRRSGDLTAEVATQEDGSKRVVLSGDAVLVLRGTLALPDGS